VDADARLGEQRLLQLIQSGRGLVGELSLDRVLEMLLNSAREVTGARYAALGILDQWRDGLERFLSRGVDQLTEQAIGDPPCGRGVLGLLIEDPRPLRLLDVSSHPRFYGFPLNHPPMSTFLGVPIVIRGEAWGNLYLAEKRNREPFTVADESAALILADWAAIAIGHARLYQHAEERRDELERAVRGLEATTAIAQAVGVETHLEPLLELIAKRARALVAARALVILLAEGDDLLVAAQAGELPPGVARMRLPGDRTLAGEALQARRPLRIDEESARLRGSTDSLGLSVTGALFVPLLYRGSGVGVLAALDRLGERTTFDEDDELLMRSFAASAATAVATAKVVAEDQLRRSLEAAERERGHWARELHDELLQALAAVRLRLAAALRRKDDDAVREAAGSAVEQLDREIGELRNLIQELRPAELDEFGLRAALSSLIERAAADEELEVEAKIELPEGNGDRPRRYSPEVETAVYRLVQEALNNVTKHAEARRAWLQIRDRNGAMQVTVADDGRGFDPDAPAEGFGLAGMRERVALLSGELEIASSPKGTRISSRIPVSNGPA
jgi:signal transduction histidine kinase